MVISFRLKPYLEITSMEIHCGICKVRISDWMRGSGKTEIVHGQFVHRTCIIDWRLKFGEEWTPKAPFDPLFAYRASRGGND